MTDTDIEIVRVFIKSLSPLYVSAALAALNRYVARAEALATSMERISNVSGQCCEAAYLMQVIASRSLEKFRNEGEMP